MKVTSKEMLSGSRTVVGSNAGEFGEFVEFCEIFLDAQLQKEFPVQPFIADLFIS